MHICKFSHLLMTLELSSASVWTGRCVDCTGCLIVGASQASCRQNSCKSVSDFIASMSYSHSHFFPPWHQEDFNKHRAHGSLAPCFWCYCFVGDLLGQLHLCQVLLSHYPWFLFTSSSSWKCPNWTFIFTCKSTFCDSFQFDSQSYICISLSYCNSL